MKKRIGKFFIILGVIFFCLTPFYSVHGEDYYHYNVFDILDSNGHQIGSAEYVLYQDFMVAHERTYVSELTINFAAYYRGPVTVSRRTYQSDYILVEGASISGASDSGITFWLAGSNFVHIKWYSSADFNTGGYFPADVFTTGLTMVEMSPGESRQDIIDALDTSNGNWTSLLQQMNDIKNLFGTGSDIQNVDVDSIRGMLNTIRSEILAIGVLDGVIATKVGELSGIADNIELLLEQIGYIAANVQIIADQTDFSALQTAISDLETAINNLSGNFTITNNINVNTHDIPFYQYLALSMLTRNNLDRILFDNSGTPYVKWSDIKNLTFTFNPGTGSNKIIFAYLATDANFTIKIDNNTLTRYRGVGNGVRYSNYYIADLSFGNHTITFSTTSNQGVISDNVLIYPLYLGRLDSVPEYVRSILAIENSSNDYSSVLNDISDTLNNLENYDDSALLDKLDDIFNAINNFNFDVDMDIVNNTVVDFNTDIDIIHNAENNILTSFNTYNQQFNTNDLNFSGWFSTTLFNYVFEHFWVDNSSFAWIITLILFCVLIAALVGLRS